MQTLRISGEHARKMAGWITDRGGILVWQSQDLSDPGARCFTPALTEGDDSPRPYPAPNWQTNGSIPKHYTRMDEIEVITPREIKRVKIALRMGGNGLSTKLTDHSSRKLRAALASAGEDAWYEFADREAVILVPGKVIPLADYLNPPVPAAAAPDPKASHWEAEKYGEDPERFDGLS